MVGAGAHLAGLVEVEGVVVLAAPAVGHGKAGAEGHPLHRRDGEGQPGDAVFHPVQHGVPQAGGQADDGALHQAAQGVQILLGLGDGPLHPCPGVRVQDGKVPPSRGQEGLPVQVHGVIALVGDAPHGGDVGPHIDPLPGQDLLADTPGDAQGGGEPAGEVAASRHVLKAPVLHLGGVVGVARAGDVPEVVIVPRPGVGVADEGGQGGAAGAALRQAGEDLRPVPLLPGGGPGAPARGPAVEEGLEFLQVDGLPGGQAVHRHPDARGVGLAEKGNGQLTVINTAHGIVLIIMKDPGPSVKGHLPLPPPCPGRPGPAKRRGRICPPPGRR